MPESPPSPPSRLIGDAEVVMLEDAAGTFFTPREAAFPAATPDQWTAADSLDPDAVTADGQWLLRFAAPHLGRPFLRMGRSAPR